MLHLATAPESIALPPQLFPHMSNWAELLTEQSGNTIRFVDVGGDSVAEDYFVLLNENEVKSLKNGLDTNLADGDVVGIGPVDLLFSGG